MAESLASTLADLNLNAQQLSGAAFDTRFAKEDNGTQENYRPRKRTRQTGEDLKASLEAEFLAPSPRFSPDWLNHLQRSVDRSLRSIGLLWERRVRKTERERLASLLTDMYVYV